MIKAISTTAPMTPEMINGVLEAAGGCCGVLAVKARNASVLPLGSTLLSDMAKTIAKGRPIPTAPPVRVHSAYQAERPGSADFTP